MEFLDVNAINTSSMISVTSSTASAANILTRDETFQWQSSDAGTNQTNAAIVIDFGVTIPVTRIGIIGMNWKDFTIFRDGNTSSTFALTSTSHTGTSDFSTNSDTSMFLRFNQTFTAKTIHFEVQQTIVADQEKALGYLHISDTKLIFPRIPSSKYYKPIINPEQIVHSLSDGKTRIHEISRYFTTKIKFKYIEKSFRDDLYGIWKEQSDFVFVAFGTSTGWDEVMFPVVWPGKFEFFQYSLDAADSGFSGTINLMESTT